MISERTHSKINSGSSQSTCVFSPNRRLTESLMAAKEYRI